MSSLVIKTNGTDEAFDERKLYASVFISLRIANESEKKAEIIAGEVVTMVLRYIGKKSHVSSRDLRTHTATQLKEYNHLAAYVYTHHRVLS